MSLYGIIDDLRREHQSPAASKTLDMVQTELGRTRDNLREALARLEGQPIPSGGREVLEELDSRARAEGVDALEAPQSRHDMAAAEPLDESQVGIAFLLGASALLSVGLAAVAVGMGVYQILHG